MAKEKEKARARGNLALKNRKYAGTWKFHLLMPPLRLMDKSAADPEEVVSLPASIVLPHGMSKDCVAPLQ